MLTKEDVKRLKAEGFRFWRDGAGAHTNFPQFVLWHSIGMEWNYAGSGPADTALNVLEIVARDRGCKSRKRAWLENESEQRLTNEAIAGHQSFKWDVIAKLPYEGGTVTWASVEAWLREKEGVTGQG